MGLFDWINSLFDAAAKAGREARARAILLRRGWPKRLPLALLALIPLLALGYLALRQVWLIDRRIQCFHELEMYEGDVALQAIRLVEGKLLYPSRESDYIPLLYTPFYSYLTAWAMETICDPAKPYTLYAGRIVSVLATCLCALTLFGWTWRETKNFLASLAAPGCFLAINPLVGTWFDLVRVDATFVALMGVGSWLLLDRRSKGDFAEALKGIVGGFFFVLAFFTKQSAGPTAIVFTGVALLISPYRALWAATAGATFGIAGQIYLNWVNVDFWFLTVTVPSNHIKISGDWLPQLLRELWLPASIMLATILAWWCGMIHRRRWRHVLAVPILLYVVKFYLRGLMVMGGYINHYLPIWFFFCLFFGIALGSLIPSSAAPRRSIGGLLGLAALPFVFYGLVVALAGTPLHGRPAGLWYSDVFKVPLDKRILRWESAKSGAAADATAPKTPQELEADRIEAVRAARPLAWTAGFFGLALAGALSRRRSPVAAANAKPSFASPIPVVLLGAGVAWLYHHTEVATAKEVSIEWNAWRNPPELPNGERAPSIRPVFFGEPPESAEGQRPRPLSVFHWDRQKEKLSAKLPKEIEKSRRVIQAIRELDGPVWIPHANYYAYLAGKGTDISSDHIRDLYVGGQSVPQYILKSLNQKKFKYILLNNNNMDHDWQAGPVLEAIKRNYRHIEDWDAKYGWQALASVDRTGQKPRALLIREDLAP